MVITETLNNQLNVDEFKPIVSQTASKSLRHLGEHSFRLSAVGNSLRSKFFDFVVDRHQVPALKCKLCQLVISNKNLQCFVHIKSCHMNQIRGPSSACLTNSVKSFILVQYLTTNDVLDSGEGTADFSSRASPYEILNGAIIEGKKMPGEIVELESRQGGVRKAIFLGVFATHSDAFREMCRLNRENNCEKKPSPRSSLMSPIEIKIASGSQKDSTSEIPPHLSPSTSNFDGNSSNNALSVFDSTNQRQDDNAGGAVTALSKRIDTLQSEMTQIKELLVQLLQNQQKMMQAQRIEEPLEFTYCSEKVVNQLMTQNDSPEAVAIALANKIFIARDRHRLMDNRDPDRVAWLRRVLEYKYVIERQNKCARDIFNLWNVCQIAVNKTVLPDIVSGNGNKRSAAEPLMLPDTLAPKTFRAMPKLTAVASSFSTNDESLTSKQSINNVSPLKIHYVPATLSRQYSHRSTTVFRPLSAGEIDVAEYSLSSKRPQSVFSQDDQRMRICRDAADLNSDRCRLRETEDAGESPPMLSEMPRLLTMGVDHDEDEERNQDKVQKDKDGDVTAVIDVFSSKTMGVTVKTEPAIYGEMNGEDVDANRDADDETDNGREEDGKRINDRSSCNRSLGSVVKIEEEFFDNPEPLEKNDDGVWTSDVTGQEPIDYNAENEDDDMDEPPPQIDIYETEGSPKSLRAVL